MGTEVKEDISELITSSVENQLAEFLRTRVQICHRQKRCGWYSKNTIHTISLVMVLNGRREVLDEVQFEAPLPEHN